MLESIFASCQIGVLHVISLTKGSMFQQKRQIGLRSALGKCCSVTPSIYSFDSVSSILLLMLYNKKNQEKQETKNNGRGTEQHLPKTDESVVWPWVSVAKTYRDETKYSFSFRFNSICLSDAHLWARGRSCLSQVSAALSPFHFCLTKFSC